MGIEFRRYIPRREQLVRTQPDRRPYCTIRCERRNNDVRIHNQAQSRRVAVLTDGGALGLVFVRLFEHVSVDRARSRRHARG